jgi:hypothetical protein
MYWLPQALVGQGGEPCLVGAPRLSAMGHKRTRVRSMLEVRKRVQVQLAEPKEPEQEHIPRSRSNHLIKPGAPSVLPILKISMHDISDKQGKTGKDNNGGNGNAEHYSRSPIPLGQHIVAKVST